MSKKSLKKEYTFKFFLAWFFGIIFFINALSSVVEGNILNFILYGIASLILIPPFYKKLNFKLSTPLKVFIILILIMLTGSSQLLTVSYDENYYETSDSIQDSIQEEVKKTPTIELKLISSREEAFVGSEYFGESADGKFIIVTFEITNNGKSTKTLTSNQFVLKNSEGIEWKEDSGATLMLATDMTGNYNTFNVIEEIGPLFEIERTLVFDIPRSVDRNDLNLVYKDSLSASTDTLLSLY